MAIASGMRQLAQRGAWPTRETHFLIGASVAFVAPGAKAAKSARDWTARLHALTARVDSQFV